MSILRTTPAAAPLVALLAITTAFACGGAVHTDVDGDAGAGPGPSTAPSSTTARAGCTPATTNGGGSGSSGGQATGTPASPDLCAGEIGCGPGQVCGAGRACCMKNGGAVIDPSPCPCPGRATAVVGTACAKSCAGTTQVCFPDPGGRNTDCLNGLECASSDSVQGIRLTTCSNPEGSSSSSGGGGPTGSCQAPTEPCPGALFACSSALSCAPGEVCCEILGAVCSGNCSDNGP